jgi:hypothetical protein
MMPSCAVDQAISARPRKAVVDGPRLAPPLAASLTRVEQMGQLRSADENPQRLGQMANRVGEVPRRVAPSMGCQVGGGKGKQAGQDGDGNETRTRDWQSDC